MKTSNFSEKERMAIVAKRDSGQSIESICRAHQISPATFLPLVQHEPQTRSTLAFFRKSSALGA